MTTEFHNKKVKTPSHHTMPTAEVIAMLITLTVVVSSQCAHIPKHHIVPLKYIQFYANDNKSAKKYNCHLQWAPL